MSTQKLVRNLSAAGKELAKNNRNATRNAAMAFKGAALTEARKDSGGDMVLSNFGKNGAKLNVGFDLEGSGSTAKATVRPRPMGPWKVLEYGAKPHPIVPGLTRRQGRAAALFQMMAGGGVVDAGQLAGAARGNRNNRGGSRRRKRATFLAAKGYGGKQGEGFMYANHPGTKAKRTWTRSEQRGADDAIKDYRTAQAKALGKVFGG